MPAGYLDRALAGRSELNGWLAGTGHRLPDSRIRRCENVSEVR